MGNSLGHTLARQTDTRPKSLDLSRIPFLVADPSEHYRSIFRAILYSFGAAGVEEAATVLQARTFLDKGKAAVMIVGYDLPGGGGLSLVKGLRLDRPHRLRSIPIIVSMSQARRMDVSGARDAGANFVLVKPFAPQTLFDRLQWIAHHPRPYWESDSYYGPDRRFRPGGGRNAPRRRTTDRAITMDQQLFEGGQRD